jgi:fermentation-respiration switch protein FrsA (DUF1100 family)
VAKRALWAATALAFAYLAALAGLYFAQSRLIYPAPQARHAAAPGFLPVTLRTTDGQHLRAHWREPAAGKPTIVYFHGNAGSLAGATAETRALAAKSYGVLLVEYRGYGGNRGTPSEVGFYRDGRAAMAFLGAKGIPTSRTIVVGNSIGSGTATQMAREFSPAALILSAPFTGLADVVHERLVWVPTDLLLRDRFDNLAKIRSLKLPVLVQHGTADTVVPYAQGRALAEAAPKATLQTFKGEGHGLSFDPAVQSAQIAWLEAQGL